MKIIPQKYMLVLFFLFLSLSSIHIFAAVSKDSLSFDFRKKIDNAEDDSLKLLNAYFDFAEYLDEQGETDSSIFNLNKALRIAQNINHYERIASIGNYLGSTYWMIGDNQLSVELFTMALENAEKTNDTTLIAKISMNLGGNYNLIGEYDKAIKYALNALRLKEKAKDYVRICYHYMALSNIFKENNNQQKCEEYTQKAYSMKDVEGCASISDLAAIYNSLGGIAMYNEEYEKALTYYDTLMIISKEAGFRQGISTSLTNSASIYKSLNQPEKALELAKKAENFFGDNPYDLIFSHNFKAELYQSMSRFSEALELAEANIIKEDINYYSTEKLRCMTLLYQLNRSLLNYEEAFRWNDSLRINENNLRDENIRKSLEELETKYQTEKKVQEIQLLTAENKIKSQRNRLATLFIGLLFVLIILVLILNYFRKKQAVYKQMELQQQLLRSQMNPHFIFNVLGSIQSFLFKNEADKAAGYLSKFASLIRSILEFSSKENVSLEAEIEMLKNYIELERIRMNTPCEVEYIIDSEMETAFIEIPPMLLQPFVENAFKHGLKNLSYPGKLILEIKEDKDYIDILIEDNGNGLLNVENQEHKSRAMEIFRQRKKGIEHRLHKKINFDIQNLKDLNPEKTGVRVCIKLPILNND